MSSSFTVVSFIAIFLLALAHLSHQQAAAICRMEKTNVVSNFVSGLIFLTFDNATNNYRADGVISGLTPNTVYGFHVHELGHLSADGLGSGGHYNPTNVPHDLPPNPVRHIGDMGNITSDALGNAIINKFGTDILWALNGNFSILGRILHIHERRDNGSQPTGDAGRRVAQCVVGTRFNSIPNLNTARNENNYTAPATLQNNYGVATCELRPRLNTYPYQGRVIFESIVGSNLVRVRARICNLTANAVLGIHVHEFGDLSEIANTTGDHYNPFNQQHGYPPSSSRHVGDMGNFTVDANGIANLNFTIDLIQLSGLQSIIGRGVVVHGSNDKGTQPLGAAGERIAACVIGVATAASDFSDACVFPALPPTPPPTPTPKVTPKPSPKTSPKINGATTTRAVSVSLFAMVMMMMTLFATMLIM